MDKKDLWPKEGKLKKAGIIILIVIIASIGIVLLEEQTGIKLSKKVVFVIALACIGVWLYQPVKKQKA